MPNLNSSIINSGIKMLTKTASSINLHSHHKQLASFVFISSCFEFWGGSEELFGMTAKHLKQQGYQVSAFKIRLVEHHRIRELRSAGIEFTALNSLASTSIKDFILGRIYHRVRSLKFLPIPNSWHHIYSNPQHTFLVKTLRKIKPAMVVISQGENFDGVDYANICTRLNLPYVIICQKASDSVWPHARKRQMMQDMYQQAKASFFVSQHNLSLTEAQIGYRLTNTEVVRNPHQAEISELLPYPKTANDVFKIACVARLWILDKGQDILLRVLAQDKWRDRHLHVSFFGSGVDRDALVDMAKLLELENVSFPGFVEDIIDLWHHHHALILPSRAEGLPIALVEAMMCGRVAIATDVGGVAEVVDDDITGFIASGLSLKEIDRVLERAWQRRYEWEDLGKAASISIRKLIPPHPEKVFADKLVRLCQSISIPSEIPEQHSLTPRGLNSNNSKPINFHSHLNKIRHFVFISSCSHIWGGSEELLGWTAKHLKQQGHQVSIFKLQIGEHPRILDLRSAGIEVVSLKDTQRTFLLKALFQIQPSLVLISQGENFDGLEYADICLELHLPYAMLSHKASSYSWPDDAIRPYMQNIFQNAKRCFFVSEHNLSLTQKQLGRNLPKAEVVRNPYLVSCSESLFWPAIKDDFFKLACVGRLWLRDKGQDILLEILAQEKWKHRNLQVSFFGEGANQESLIDLASFLGLKNVSFHGFVENIVNVWQEYHALILPSRAEGLPITLIEAMMCGRMGITTDVGGIPEVLEDNITGFIAQGACFASIDEALERAWLRRDEWESMGKEASISIRELIPLDPERLFADKLVELSMLQVDSTEIGDKK